MRETQVVVFANAFGDVNFVDLGGAFRCSSRLWLDGRHVSNMVQSQYLTQLPCLDVEASRVAARWYVKGMKFTVAVTHETPWYVARCLEVDVVSQSDSVEEAVANLREALSLYFEGEKLPLDLEPPIITTVLLPA
jgi:predicted RNase H-like HicB family nuclease